MSVMHRADALDLFLKMSVARAIEERCAELSGLWYPAIGEEAAVVGAHWCAEHDDVLYPHYRGSLAVQWMRGRSLEDIFLAMLNRDGVASRGRHAPPFDGFIGGRVMPYASIMLGPNIAMAAGVSLALKYRGGRAIAIAGFGDGTSGTGDFHETLNMAEVLGLPTVFVCQNNQFSISTSARDALAGTSICDWASRYGMPADSVDGNDVVAVVTAVRKAIDYTRAEQRPSFVELRTYRRTGHFVADPALYRDQQEVRDAEAADPIMRLARHLGTDHAVPTDDINRIAARARADVAAAADYAAGQAELTEKDLDLTGVYAR